MHGCAPAGDQNVHDYCCSFVYPLVMAGRSQQQLKVWLHETNACQADWTVRNPSITPIVPFSTNILTHLSIAQPLPAHSVEWEQNRKEQNVDIIISQTLQKKGTILDTAFESRVANTGGA